MALVVAPRTLARFRAQLLGKTFTGAKEVSRMIALAECNFRLAIHPETDFSEAIPLLEESIRLDGTNPKYAHHLGRIYLLRGQFSQAARWFRLACCLAPTSHRVWAHVAVLMRELNVEYRGNEDYDDVALVQRADAISQAIRDGQDNIDPNLLDFVPPKSLAAKEKEARQDHRESGGAAKDSRKQLGDDLRPSAQVRRFLNAGTCRWSGIDHLYFEQALEGRTSQGVADRLMPTLQELAERSGRRPGGAGAVAILCVQWLLCGYPVETIRRILPLIPESLPSHALVEEISRIVEAPVESVPVMIVQALEHGRLPPLVAAMLHRLRLLWQPLEFRNLGTYRASRRMIAEWKQTARDNGQHPPDAELLDAARDLTRRLERAIDDLSSTPPKPLKDKPPAVKRDQIGGDGPSPLEIFEACERAASKLVQFKEEGFRLLKDSLEAAAAQLSTVEALSQTTADQQAAGEFVTALSETTEACLHKLQELAELIPTVPGIALGDDFAARQEACVATLQGVSNLGKFGKSLKRIESRITAAAEQFPASPTPPSAEWSALLAGVKAVSPEATSIDGAPTETTTAPLAYWLAESDQFLERIERDWTILRECVERHRQNALTDDDTAQLARMRPEFDAMQTTSDERVATISALRDSGTVAAAEIDRLETAEQHYREVLKARGKFLKNFAKLPEIQPQAPTAQESTTIPVAIALEAADSPVVTTVPVESPKPPPAKECPPPKKPRNDMHALELLEYTLIRVDWTIQRMFTTALQTFDAYPQWICMLPSFAALHRQTTAQQAETTYRLGRRRLARTLWNQMLRTHRLDPGTIKNIAIHDTVEGDAGRSLASWREYLELLYLFDVMVGNPRPHAGIRSQFHRSFGAAYAPAFLSAKFGGEWIKSVDAASLIAFLSSRGRVRNDIDHRLLEYLNSRFEFDSPSLVLGIKRVEAESLTDAAEKTQLSFVETVGTMIPGRVAPAFVKLAHATLKRAAERCRDSRRLTLHETPNYADEEKRQIELLVRIFDVKIKLLVAFNHDLNLVKNITSLDFLSELSRLDQIPLEVSPGLFPIVANTMGVGADLLRDATITLRQNVVYALLKYLLADDDSAEQPIRQRQYELLTGTWLRDPGFQSFTQLIDTPLPFIPQVAADAFTQKQEDVILGYLRRWHDQYPAFAGLATQLAYRLFPRKELEEARTRLERSRPLATFAPTRRQIHYLLVQILIRDCQPLVESQDFPAVLDLSLKMLALDDFQVHLIQEASQLFAGVSLAKKKRYRESEFRAATDGWLDRATALADSPPHEADELARPTHEQLNEARKAIDEAFDKVKHLR